MYQVQSYANLDGDPQLNQNLKLLGFVVQMEGSNTGMSLAWRKCGQSNSMKTQYFAVTSIWLDKDSPLQAKTAILEYMIKVTAYLIM